jgi:hypothetical protein
MFFMVRLSCSNGFRIGLRRMDTYHLYFIPAKTALPLPGSNNGDVAVA